MKLLRFAIVALCLIGAGVCVHAAGRIVGLVPPGKLPIYPSWIAVHFATGTVFAVLTPLQLWPALRNARPRLHRLCGRTAVAVGAVMALSGVAMVHLVPDRPVSERIFMTLFFTAYAAFLALGFRAALARDPAAHRRWMIRMTATALTPITQRLVFPVFAATIGVDGRETFWQLFVTAAWIAWAINAWTAEIWLNRGAIRAPIDAARLA